MLLALRSLWEEQTETALSGTPRKRPIRRKPPPVTYGSWMLAIDAEGHLTDEEFLLLSSIDLD